MPNNTAPRARDAQNYADFVESMQVNGIVEDEIVQEQAKSRGVDIARVAGVKTTDPIVEGGNPTTMTDSKETDDALADGSAAAKIPETGVKAVDKQ